MAFLPKQFTIKRKGEAPAQAADFRLRMHLRELDKLQEDVDTLRKAGYGNARPVTASILGKGATMAEALQNSKASLEAQRKAMLEAAISAEQVKRATLLAKAEAEATHKRILASHVMVEASAKEHL